MKNIVIFGANDLGRMLKYYMEQDDPRKIVGFILLLKNPIDNRIFEERLLRRLQSALPIAVSYNPLRHLRRLNSDR